MATTTITCSCGAVYERTENKAPVRDSDSFDCVCCGVEVEPWNDTRWPSFKLISRPQHAPKPD